MLYESLSQPAIFLYMVLAGVLAGFLFDLKDLACIKLKKNKFFSHFFAFFATFFTLFLCFFFNLKFNYGQFRFFSIASFALAFATERFFVKNFLANPISKCYNRLKKNYGRKRAKEKV